MRILSETRYAWEDCRVSSDPRLTTSLRRLGSELSGVLVWRAVMFRTLSTLDLLDLTVLVTHVLLLLSMVLTALLASMLQLDLDMLDTSAAETAGTTAA